MTLTVTEPVPAGDGRGDLRRRVDGEARRAVLPNCTAVAPVKLVPVMTTLVPPAAGPDVGARPVTVGAGTKVKVPADVPVPPTVVTLTVPSRCRPAMTAVICVAELTVKLAAAVPPNCTAVAPVKLVPVMTTLVPPAAGPDVGARPVTVGAGRR